MYRRRMLSGNIPRGRLVGHFTCHGSWGMGLRLHGCSPRPREGPPAPFVPGLVGLRPTTTRQGGGGGGFGLGRCELEGRGGGGGGSKGQAFVFPFGFGSEQSFGMGGGVGLYRYSGRRGLHGEVPEKRKDRHSTPETWHRDRTTGHGLPL